MGLRAPQWAGLDAVLHKPLSRELARITGTTASGGTLGTYPSRLRSNELVREESGLIYLVDILRDG